MKNNRKEESTLEKTLFEYLEKEGKVVLSEDAKKKISATVFAVKKEKDATIASLKSILAEAAEEIKALRTTRLAEAKKEIALFESKLIDKMSHYLDSEMKVLIPQNLVEAQAKLEVLEPLVESIKDTFTKNGIQIDNKGFGLLKQAKNEIISLTGKLNKAVAQKIELTESTEKLLGRYLLNDKTNGLTETQKKKVFSIFENSSYEEIDEKFNAVRDLVITEADGKAVNKDKTPVVRKRVSSELDAPEKTISEGKYDATWKDSLRNIN